MTTDEIIASLDVAIRSIKRLNELRRSEIQALKELRELNAELLAVIVNSVREYDVTGEVANILEMRVIIAKANKLK